MYCLVCGIAIVIVEAVYYTGQWYMRNCKK